MNRNLVEKAQTFGMGVSYSPLTRTYQFTHGKLKSPELALSPAKHFLDGMKFGRITAAVLITHNQS